MYNRYIRNDNGSYSRVPQEDTIRQTPHSAKASQQQEAAHPPKNDCPPLQKDVPISHTGRITDGLTGVLQHFLDQLHLDLVDTGDLLLLVLLFFLFREDADEELLVALGLLLIL